MSEPPTLTPRDAVDRWLSRQQLDKADATLSGYRRRLSHFVEFCEDNEIETVNELTPWDVESYETRRRGRDVATITLRNELLTFRQFLRYLARVGIIDEAVPKAVELPNVSAADQADETLLEPARAERILSVLRDGKSGVSARSHAVLEVAWFTGARLGAMRGLDVGDVDLDDGWVRFQHRPESGTPLKNGKDGERVVGISDDVAEAIARYRENAPSQTDQHGRRPLWETPFGRVSTNTVRTTVYQATLPCRVGPCPHGKDPETCEWTTQQQASKCPSSRSPHQIRSGSITWQLNRGLRADVVAERVNASVDVIEQHYDRADEFDQFEERRRRHLQKLNFEEADNA